MSTPFSGSTFFSDYTKKGVCCYCDGRPPDYVESGSTGETYLRTCGYCKDDFGKPFPEQVRKAKLEEQGICTTCEFELALHGGQRTPHGCDVAIRALVRDQRAEID